MTDAETIIWRHLKKGINGLKFRRQHPIGLYIADFFCHKARLIIEVDGLIHSKPEIKEVDESRQKELESWGYTIIRFTNEQVMKNAEEVINIIIENISNINNTGKESTQ